jgi:very-short-patch-repair endonuclease
MHKRQLSPKLRALHSARAREMRLAPTPSEARLFEALRGRRLGVVVKRQVPIGGFIVDLLVPAAMLIIEVDGTSHAGRKRADERRDRKLRRLGYRVLRLEAKLVMKQLEVAVQSVKVALEQ